MSVAVMELHYRKTPEGNFGDDLNLWLWDDLLPGWKAWAPDITLVGVGTLLQARALPEGPKLVLGSGTGYGTAPDVSDAAQWDIRAVRGPRTAAALALPAAKAMADPAVLLPTLPRLTGIPRGDETLFVPHHKSVAAFDWPTICAGAGLGYQSPTADAETVIRRIATARRVIAESMHAAIIADAFGVPWRAVSIHAGFNPFKWGDWAESVGLDDVGVLPLVPGLGRARGLIRRTRRILRRPTVSPAGDVPPGAAALAGRRLRQFAQGQFRLSDRGRLAEVQERLTGMLAQVRVDFSA